MGDVFGEPGRAALAKLLPKIRDQYKIDLAVVNVENAAAAQVVLEEFARNNGAVHPAATPFRDEVGSPAERRQPAGNIKEPSLDLPANIL